MGPLGTNTATAAAPAPAPATATAGELFCPECGFDLRGIEIDRCPECGLKLDAQLLSRSHIPWVYHRELGRWKAFRRTFWMVVRRPRDVAAEAAKPVDLSDALAFRRMVVAVAMAGVVPLTVWLYCMSVAASVSRIDRLAAHPWGWFFDALILPMTWLGAALFFTFAAGVASYFFHPGNIPVIKQNRAIALSYYASAPMAIVPWGAMLFAAVLSLAFVERLERFTNRSTYPVLLITSIAPVLLCIIASYVSPLVLMQRTTGCGAARVITAAVVLPVCWVVLFGCTLVGIPAAYFYVELVMASRL